MLKSGAGQQYVCKRGHVAGTLASCTAGCRCDLAHLCLLQHAPLQQQILCVELEQNAMEEVGKLVEERTAYRIEDQVDLETEALNRRTEREKAEDEEKLQEVTITLSDVHQGVRNG